MNPPNNENMTTANKSTEKQEVPTASDSCASPCSVSLTDSERNQIAEILDRRAREVNSFRSDLESAVQQKTDTSIKLYQLPGSVELAINREVNRLRKLAEKIKVPEPPEEDED